MKPQPPTSPSATAASADTTRAGEVSRRSFVGNSIKGVTALTVAAPLAAQAADADQREPTAHDTAVAVPSAGTQTVDRSFATELVPGDCDYRVALPPGYSADRDHAYPLLLLLHGGGGSRDFLTTLLPALDELWLRAITSGAPEQPALAGDDQLEPCVAVCASAGRSFYMDHRDGSAAWETLLVTELLDAVRAEFNVATESGRTAVCGVSMGGMGCLRLAFKHPDLFGTVAALEPAIESSLRYDTLKPADTFYRADQYVEKFGVDGAVDRDYWARNNPATIAATGPIGFGTWRSSSRPVPKTGSNCTRARSFCTACSGTGDSSTSTGLSSVQITSVAASRSVSPTRLGLSADNGIPGLPTRRQWRFASRSRPCAG